MYRRRHESHRSSKPKLHLKNKNKIKFGDKRFSIWRMELLHPAMWHNHDIDFARWLHPAMWHVALELWQWIHQVAAPCNVTRGSGMTCRWIRRMAQPCNVTMSCSSGIMTWNSPAPCNVVGGSVMTCYVIRPNVCHIGNLHLVSNLTISLELTCHSAPVCEILSKSDHPQQKKMTSCRFSRWRISVNLDFRGLIMCWLKSPGTTFCRSSIEIIALNCLVFLRKSSFCIMATDRRTDRQPCCMKPLSLSRAAA